MDQALVAIAEAAERGQQVPRVALLTAAGTISGLPIGSTEYLVRLRPSLSAAHLANLKASEGVKRRERDAAMAQSEQWADADIASFGAALDGPAGAITLGDVSVILSATGEVVTTAVVRVPFIAVSAWFTGAFEAKKPSGGGGFFIGGMVPLDFGG
jgi:hypothetical protein